MFKGRKDYPSCIRKRLEKHQNEENKKLLLKYWNHILTKGSGKQYRPAKIIGQLLRLIDKHKINLSTALQEEWEPVLVDINTNNKWSNATKCDYRRAIRQIYNWYKKQDEKLWGEKAKDTYRFYSWLEEFVKVTYQNRKIDPKEILTEENLDEIIDRKLSATTLRDNAIVTLLWESGIRSGELLEMKIKDFRVDKNFGIGYIDVDGKTGKRSPEVIRSLKHILKWIEIHPQKDDKEAYLWLKYRGQGVSGRRICNLVLNRILKEIFKKVDLKKKSNPHWFRHSAATRLAPLLTFPVFCRYFGWTLTSRQAKTYVHLCQKQQTDAFLRMHNLQRDESLEDKYMKCSCGVTNESRNMMCFKCGRPLRVEDAITLQNQKDEEISKTWQVFIELMKNPQLLQEYQEVRNKYLQKS